MVISFSTSSSLSSPALLNLHSSDEVRAKQLVHQVHGGLPLTRVVVLEDPLEHVDEGIVNHLGGDSGLLPAGEGLISGVSLVQLLEEAVDLAKHLVPSGSLILFVLQLLSIG